MYFCLFFFSFCGSRNPKPKIWKKGVKYELLAREWMTKAIIERCCTDSIFMWGSLDYVNVLRTQNLHEWPQHHVRLPLKSPEKTIQTFQTCCWRCQPICFLSYFIICKVEHVFIIDSSALINTTVLIDWNRQQQVQVRNFPDMCCTSNFLTCTSII